MSRGFIAANGKPAGLWLPTSGLGPKAYDFSHNRNTGTLAGGITPSANGWGVLGSSWLFSGLTSQSVNLSTSIIGGQSKATFLFAVNPAIVDTTQYGVFSKTIDSSTSYIDGIIGVFSAGDLFFRVGTGVNAYVFTATGAVAAGKEALIALVFDGTLIGDTNRLKIFVNGVQVATTAGSGFVVPATLPTNAVPLLLGRYYDQGANNKPFNGRIAMASVVFSALTTTQLSSLYQALLTGQPYPLFEPRAADMVYGGAVTPATGKVPWQLFQSRAA